MPLRERKSEEERIRNLFSALRREVRHYKVPVIDLIEVQTGDPYRVLVGTILSARTKDETTAAASKRLFEKAKNLDELAKLSVKEIEALIFPVGFYKNKARFLKELPKAIRNEFNGEIPKTLEGLMQLPGVGRKTANLVLSVAFKKPAICVDTHVHRISNRLGLVKTSTPLETELALRSVLPKRYWKEVNRFFVALGQNICSPISPKCSRCPIRKECGRIGVEKSR
ncbi:endonuclease III [Candidatus Woesearchaeota archaeon]|nr:MAG: endonuclease III [Candidatus Woesearchaeota archaeon]